MTTIDSPLTISERMFGELNKEFIKYKSCRFCKSKDVAPVIDLGKMPLAGGFLKNSNDFKKEKKYPLELLFCRNCYLLQTSISINPDTLFKNYFYYSSTINTLVAHFQKTAKDLRKDLKKGIVLEIGSNDGEFIKALQKEGFNALGVDPASNIVKPQIKAGLPMINDFFSEKLARKIVKKYGQADAIYSFHTLAHIPDMNDIVRGIKLSLKPEGFLAFEVHYLGNLLSEMQYDMIYHEHLHYYSLIALQNFFGKYEMEIFKVERNNLRAGSITYFVQNMDLGKRKIKKSVLDLRNEEIRKGFNKEITYQEFNKKIVKTKLDLLSTLDKLASKNVAGYGASGRGTVVANYVGLNSRRMKFVVDDSPAKQGNYMPGTHNPIFNPEELTNQKIDYAIVFAWPFINEVIKRNKKYLKNGGKFIIPLPKVKTTDGK